MKTLYNLLEDFYPDVIKKIRNSFPNMIETAKLTQIIDWKNEFAIFDINPELIDKINLINTQWKQGIISAEERDRRLRRLSGGGQKTRAVTFVREKKVSFRDPEPELKIILHELGHIHFKVGELEWNASQAGGEILLYLSLEGKYKIGEKNLKRFFKLTKDAWNRPYQFCKHVVDKIYPSLAQKVFPHFYTICLFAGLIPSGAIRLQGLDLTSKKWALVEVLDLDAFFFIQDLVTGLVQEHPVLAFYAQELGIID